MKNINWPRFFIGLLFLILLAALAKNLIGGVIRKNQRTSATKTQV